jgi:hypothetical protein
VPYKPETLLADGAVQIRNAFKKVFGPDSLLRICFFHVILNCSKKLKEKTFQTDKNEILKNIRTLHQITDNSLFYKAVRIFESKWDDKHPEFIQYFKKQYVDKMPGWFLGFSPGTPSSNSGTEAKNGAIKKYFTKHLKLSLLEANTTFLEMVRQWSAVYTTSVIKVYITLHYIQ